MIIGKSKRELEKMRAAGQLVGLVLQDLREMVEPGISTIEIDRRAEKMIRDAGALPTFKGYHGFPYSICASVNEQVVHGFPSDYKLKEGDIFSIDCGVTLDGYVGDTATTVPVGRVSDEWLALVRVTEECLDRAIEEQAKSLLGADLVIGSRQPFSAEQDALFREIGGEQSRETSFSSMIFFSSGRGTRLVQVRALDGGFPFYGKLETEPAGANCSSSPAPSCSASRR